MFTMPTFAYPWWLLALVVPVILLLWRPWRGGVAFGAFDLARSALRPSRGPVLWRLLVAAALSLLIIAAARPKIGEEIQINEAKGRDLMLVIDLSLSMITDDLIGEDGHYMHRLDAVVQAAMLFIDGRKADRIGVVFFANDSQLGCPLTFDHETVKQFLTDVQDRQKKQWESRLRRRIHQDLGILGDGTNIGLGLGEALRCLTDQESEGRAIILITDGRDSEQLDNWVDPVKAARHCKNKGVRTYAIGVGDRDGTRLDIIPYYFHNVHRRVPVDDQWLPDMRRLDQIVSEGDGELLRADDMEQLEAVFATIDDLEPSRHEVRIQIMYSDAFEWPLLLGISVLLSALLLEGRLRGSV